MKVKNITIEVSAEEFKDKLDIRDGIDGKDGKNGKDGEKGEKGDKGDIPDHKWVGTKLKFEKPDGEWGKEVDLLGKSGAIYQMFGGSDSSKYIPKTQNTLLKYPTGFDLPENVVVTYDSTTRKVTLTGTFVAYWQGDVITALTSGWVSTAHTATNGVWFLYYNGSAFVWSQTPWTLDMLQIAYVYFGATDKFAIRETHGMMEWTYHEEFHETIGAYNDGGGDLSAYTLNSTTAANRRPNVSTTIVKDEDNPTTNPTLTSKLYTKEFLTGTGTNNFAVETADIVPLSGSNPYYNQFTGGAWQQTLMANNSYMSVWLVAVPTCAGTTCQKYRYIWIQGQTNGTLSKEQALSPSNLNLGSLSNIFTEFVFIDKIIIRYTAANWTIVQVDKLLGTKISQLAISGNFLTTIDSSTPTGFTAGSIPFSNGTTLAEDNANLFWDYTNNRLGIGTTTPAYKLDILGTTPYAFRLKGSDGGGLILGSYNVDWGGFWASSVTPSMSNFAMIASMYGTLFNAPSGSYVGFGIDGTRAMTINSAGNVGIGTTNPSQKLQVDGNVIIRGLGAFIGTQTTDNNYSTYISLSSTVGATPTNPAWSFRREGYTNDFDIASYDGTVETPRLKILKNGNVGIGTSTPNATLQVVGNSHFGEDTTNYSEFEADGTLILHGTATTYEDLTSPALALKVKGTGIRENVSENTMDFETTADYSDDYLYTNFQMSHTKMMDTGINLHIHWEQTENRLPNFLFQYRWQSQCNEKTTAWTFLPVTNNACSFTGTTLNQISFGEEISITHENLSDILQIRLYRDTANDSGQFSGVDTYSTTASVVFVDVHYRRNSLGSRDEFNK